VTALGVLVVSALETAAQEAPDPPAEASPAQTPRSADRAEAYYQFARAKALEGQGDWEGALAAFNLALEADPTNSWIYSEIASAYLARNQIRDAVEYSERAIRANPDNLAAHQLLS